MSFTLNLNPPPPRKLRLADEADTRIPITRVLAMVGIRIPGDADTGRSMKVHCPFGDIYHSDHGLSPAMRLYPDANTAYCFSCKRHYTPVSLAARAWEVHPRIAASRLLDQAGIVPASGRRTWEQVVAAPEEAAPDRTLLADAFKTWCRRTVPDFSRRQYEPDVATHMTQCLALLAHVHTQEDALTWLNGCKSATSVALQSRAAVS